MANYNINNVEKGTAINNIEYSWTSVSINILGQVIKGIDSINFDENFDKTAVYGIGNKPVSYTTGQKAYSGSLTIHRSEYDKLTKAAILASKESILDLEPFSILVLIQNADEVKYSSTTLEGCLLTTNGNSGSQSSAADPLMVTLDFVFLDLKNNII